MNRAALERRARQWRHYFATRAGLFALAAGLVAAGLCVRASAIGAAALGIGTTVAVGVVLRRRSPAVDALTVAGHLDRIYPALEESASLWLREPASLTLVESLQLRRLEAAWAMLPDRDTAGCPPRQGLTRGLAACAGAALILLAGVWWARGVTTPLERPAGSAPVVRGVVVAAAPSLRTASLTVVPPAYLGAAARRVEGLDAEVAEGATVTWELGIDGDVSAVELAVAGSGEGLPATALGGGRFQASTVVADTRIYQLAVRGAHGERTLWPQVHTLKVIRDQPPRLAWQEPAAARTVVEPVAAIRVPVKIAASDDHGVAAVELVMTVAKGTGEGVKFREQVLALERLSESIAGAALYGRVLDLAALGLEPGDELYFHALATDGRTPMANQARSETRFVVLRGPDSAASSPGATLAGINLVPQYFRSQRQLIIDTERLLAERAQLSADVFRQRSEDIGIDQKLLRLRYGQFLGEEFEPASTGAPPEAQAMAFAGRVRAQQRDPADRTAAVERAIEAQHAHPATPDPDGRPKTLAELAAPFTHFHDNAEAATLFDLQVKASLRAVLAAMWEAEGLLRTGRPAEALPPENRALELLKALQQADRVYVKRVGFEPAPLRLAERRLQGALETIPKRALGTLPPPEGDAGTTALRSALAALSEGSLEQLSPEIGRNVERQLLTAAQQQPENYVTALEIWRRRDAPLGAADHRALRKAAWSLLPMPPETPHRAAEGAPGLGRRYFEALTGRPVNPP